MIRKQVSLDEETKDFLDEIFVSERESSTFISNLIVQIVFEVKKTAEIEQKPLSRVKKIKLDVKLQFPASNAQSRTKLKGKKHEHYK